MRENKCKTQIIKKSNYQGLTKKKLEFVLPQLKQLMEENSSIKYNGTIQNTEFYFSQNKNQDKLSDQSLNQQNKRTQNYQTELISGNQYNISDNTSEVLSGKEDFRIIAQNFKNISGKRINCDKQIVSVTMLFDQEQKFSVQNYNPITSIRNILPPSRLMESSISEQQRNHMLMERISKLQNLVTDIIAGKIVIPRQVEAKKNKQKDVPKQSQKMEESTLIQSPQVKPKKKRALTQVNENSKASFTQNILKQPKIIEKTETEQKKKGSMLRIAPEQKHFCIKKKQNLKLTTNYPINEKQPGGRLIISVKGNQNYTNQPKLKLNLNILNR